MEPESEELAQQAVEKLQEIVIHDQTTYYSRFPPESPIPGFCPPSLPGDPLGGAGLPGMLGQPPPIPPPGLPGLPPTLPGLVSFVMINSFHFTTHARIHTRTHTRMHVCACLLYTSPSPRDATLSRMPSSA